MVKVSQTTGICLLRLLPVVAAKINPRDLVNSPMGMFVAVLLHTELDRKENQGRLSRYWELVAA